MHFVDAPGVASVADQVRTAINKGVKYLKNAQKNGRWETNLTLNHPGGQTAMVLLEPMLGEGGVLPAPAGYLAAAAQTAADAGALFAVDEVQTGIGRTGSWFMHQADGLQPGGIVSGPDGRLWFTEANRDGSGNRQTRSHRKSRHERSNAKPHRPTRRGPRPSTIRLPEADPSRWRRSGSA